MPTNALAPELLIKMDAYWRAANYLSVGQIYLYDNPLLRRPLTLADVKHMLLGHWGTTPGQNFIYVHLNRIIKKYDLDMIYVSGPGHGGPAVVANTYLEGMYSEIYPNISQDEAGLQKLFLQFSFPGGIPSHASPECPGSIHEGGELGYSLSHAFGAVFDNPSLVVACVVGDGEAETGPFATAWHSNKFLNPATDGAVLPILHLNGYKIANPTVRARITREELEQLLRGYGWTPYFVEGHEPALMHEAMAKALDTAVEQIKKIQEDERGRLRSELAELAPKGERRMGANPHANGGMLLRDLRMPDFCDYAVDVPAPGVRGIGDTRAFGRFLRDVVKQNNEERNFRVFGPDETLSNGLEAIFEATQRQWDGVTAPNDVWQWASNDQAVAPDVVMACCGDVPTLETLAAVSILREHLPGLKIRVVNVVDLMRLQPQSEHPHGLSDVDFDELFTKESPVIFAFHAYPWLIHRLTYRRTNHGNIHVRGYKEEGTIDRHGQDMPEIRDWKWNVPSPSAIDRQP